MEFLLHINITLKILEYRTIIPSPLGNLLAIADDHHLLVLAFVDGENIKTTKDPRTREMKEFVSNTHYQEEKSAILTQTEQELSDYFASRRKIFTLPLAPNGTIFQKNAWKALIKIPYGETRSYKEEAVLAGNPKAIRAIGGANNKNPIVIIIPCHRVIGTDGSIVGYGGGIERKKWLLNHEKKIPYNTLTGIKQFSGIPLIYR